VDVYVLAVQDGEALAREVTPVVGRGSHRVPDRRGPSGLLATMVVMDAADLVAPKITTVMRARVAGDPRDHRRPCAVKLDAEYAELCRRLVARLARKRPSPLACGGRGMVFDARMLAFALQGEARRRGLSPDLGTRRAA